MNLPPCFLRIARIQINWLMKIRMRYYAKYIVQYLYNFIQKYNTRVLFVLLKYNVMNRSQMRS